MSSTSDDATNRDPVDLLAEQFLQRHRADSHLTVEAFAAAHPEHASTLRELLPTLLALEGAKRERASSGSGRRRAVVPPLARLGDFRIVGELGRGGMGVVFEAEQESLGRKVALKVLSQASLLAGNQLERFRREAQIAAQLHHSNIVPVFGSGESDGWYWYAMQFIVGTSLDRWRDAQAEAPPAGSGAWQNRARFVARLGVQAAAALHYAHGLGTLHRDIKPANLMLEQNDHLWVTDFGLAKALEGEGLTHSGDLLGTLQYMAPEQFAGTYDVRSEVYALGVTLYELLTTRPAFAAGSRSELMERIRTQRPEPLRRACPELPEDVVVVVEKAMAHEPVDRYQDADALARDLQAFLDDRPIAARRLPAAGVVWRWCRRNRGMATLAASTALAVVAAGTTGWVAYGIAGDALQRAESSAVAAAQQKHRAEKNLTITLDAFGEVFDALVGPDPALQLEEDEDTGEQTVVVRGAVEPRDVALLNQMLAFYGQFATDNAGNQSLQLETARAYRRVGAIHARLGKPSDLEAAAAAYAQALARFDGISDRDVRREVAGVHAEIGQLAQRRMRPAEAVRAFEHALALLAAVPNAETKSVRSERARVHLAFAQSLLPRRGGGGPGRRPPSALGERFPDGERERQRRAEEQLQHVVELVDGLLAEEPGHAEFRAMQARSQLTAARLNGRRSEVERRERRTESARNEAEAERARLVRNATDTLRELVAAQPDNSAYRFEFVEALLEAQPRREGGPAAGPGGGPGGGPGRERAPAPAELEARLRILREAKPHTARLLALQPDSMEFRTLAARVSAQLGAALRDEAAGLPTAERDQELAAAEAELRLAAGLNELLLAGGIPAEPRVVLQAIDTRRELCSLYLATRRREEALAEARAVVALLEAQIAGVATEGPPPLRQRLWGLFENRQLAHFEELLQRLGDPTIQQSLSALRQKLPERPRPGADRPRDERPADGRGGR